MLVSYRAGLGSALRGVALPYGYTLSIWSAGAILIHEKGNPGVGETALFAAGAVAAYAVLRLLAAQPHEQPPRQLGASPASVRAGVIHVVAIGAAIAVAAPVAAISGWTSWSLSGLSTTAVYLAFTALEPTLLAAGEDEPEA